MGPPQFHTPLSSTQKDHSFSALKIPQYHTKNPSVPHAPQFHTRNPSVLTKKNCKACLYYISYIELFCVELRGFRCGTEEGVLNWGVFGVVLRDFGSWKGVALLSGTDVLNWGGCGTEGDLILYYLYFIKVILKLKGRKDSNKFHPTRNPWRRFPYRRPSWSYIHGFSTVLYV